ncbi:MAG: RES family NAD+ phosphorylase [Betaproteobacteria bacterium]|nr:RES family NAD+ phosphorylase [Betaproteobacteria bacterium]
MKPAWKATWFERGVRSRQAALWRGVEAQHVVATMRLVDGLAEQEMLESLIEASKPPVPAGAQGLHFLLFTPFRYRSPIASRFRGVTDPGVWYGAEEIETACAEVAYWKWRFLQDSEGLQGRTLYTGHTLFMAGVRGRCADLTAQPWSASARTWSHKSDYAGCRMLAREARDRAVKWIRYASARAEQGICGAVLEPEALSIAEPLRQQTWACSTTREGAFMKHAASGQALEFPAARWA